MNVYGHGGGRSLAFARKILLEIPEFAGRVCYGRRILQSIEETSQVQVLLPFLIGERSKGRLAVVGGDNGGAKYQ